MITREQYIKAIAIKEQYESQVESSPESVYGVWEVTTEGDEEGRTVKRLGKYLGYIDEIALHLADKVYYSLSFRKSDGILPEMSYTPKKSSVDVSLDISNNVKRADGLLDLKKRFANRPVFIGPSYYYSSFKIYAN